MKQDKNEQINRLSSMPADREVLEPVRFCTAEVWQDAVAISRMAHAIWNEHYTPIIGSDQVEYMLRHFQSAAAVWKAFTEDHTVYVKVCSGSAPAGYLAYKLDRDQKRIFISKFYLLAAFRGRGVARQMLNYVSSLASKEKLSIIWLTVNINNLKSIQAYLKMGFEIKGKCLQDIGSGYVMDDYIMEKHM